jgi:hypothetical protein
MRWYDSELVAEILKHADVKSVLGMPSADKIFKSFKPPEYNGYNWTWPYHLIKNFWFWLIKPLE